MARLYVLQTFLAKGTPKPSPGPRFHRAVTPPRKDCRPYESCPRDCIPCDPAQRRAALGTTPNRPPVGCRQSLAALDRPAGTFRPLTTPPVFPCRGNRHLPPLLA